MTFAKLQRSPDLVTLELDLDFDDNLDTSTAGDHCMQIW